MNGDNFDSIDGYLSYHGFPQAPGPALEAGGLQSAPLNAIRGLQYMEQQEKRQLHQISAANMDGASPAGAGTGSGTQTSRYVNQKRRDWNTFGQYLRNHRPPLALAKCSGAHVLEFLRYLDQFGKTRVHVQGCAFFGQPQPPAACACPLRQAWGSLDALIGRLRAAFEENGGTPESNPFGARAAKARGIAFQKKKKRKPSSPAASTNTSSITDNQFSHHHNQQQQHHHHHHQYHQHQQNHQQQHMREDSSPATSLSVSTLSSVTMNNQDLVGTVMDHSAAPPQISAGIRVNDYLPYHHHHYGAVYTDPSRRQSPPALIPSFH
ncbi:hypothetical protein KP509_18G075200 [Ceratopteris richardii]|uniref:ALOG domain-containing protein n=1 Tax=Ceratopteris richardii TaxID=49495 RepID=A0A8T2SUP8_CERRI|nr:hypothetical protein KP509_18G075200 [Ceratopteris richardii]